MEWSSIFGLAYVKGGQGTNQFPLYIYGSAPKRKKFRVPNIKITKFHFFPYPIRICNKVAKKYFQLFSAIIKKQCQEIADGTVINDSWQHNDFNHNDLDRDRDIGFLQLGSETSGNFVTTPTSELPSTPSSHLALPISNYDPSITSYSEYSLKNCAEYTLTEHTQDMLLQVSKRRLYRIPYFLSST